ncbi:MAG TPA: site-specific integrase [Gemmataceae bacterium]|jgi:integrase|nr:site-specific integrase [Gemmataceae bacterium]
MPRPNHIPSLRQHKPSNQAVVTLNGKDHYLGPWPRGQRRPEAEVKGAYDALIAEWIANGRRLPGPEPEPLTVTELIVTYFARHVSTHYRRPDGTPTTEVNEYRQVLRQVRELFGRIPAVDFSPLKLKAVREQMVAGGLARTTINQRVDRVKRMFRWAVSEELLPETTFRALTAVGGLQRGRTTAKETEPILPVETTDVEATLPYLSRTLQAMVRMQLLTGMRSGELCSMQTGNIDRSGPVWLYIPPSHKTSHRGRSRVIAIGPRAQEVLTPFLRIDMPDAYLFSPAADREERYVRMRACRKTKVQPSQVCRRQVNPQRKTHDRFRPPAYAQRVAYAIERANQVRIEQNEAPIAHWHPHQLRHTHGTEVRRKFGLEAAQVVLGHASAQITQIYAERDQAQAVAVAATIG